jgi:hypothetical protein
MRALTVLTAIELVVSAANSETKHFAAMGVGTTTCTQFANLYKADQGIEEQYFAWTQGYLSGQNDVRIENKMPYRDLASLSTDAQQRFLRSYCDKHPLGDYLEAVWSLLEELKTAPSP